MQLNEISKEDLKDTKRMSEDNIRDKLVRFLKSDQHVTDKEFHIFAEDNGFDYEHVEELAYAMLRELLKNVGKHNHVPDSDFDVNELSKGIEVELEHTDDEYIAKMIAKDHLSELPDYYTRLLQMEKEAK